MPEIDRAFHTISSCRGAADAGCRCRQRGGGGAQDPLAAAIASPSRTAKFTARDQYRHPLETLRFFGLRPNQTVVEIWPGRGWYMEILAPYLREHGKYYAAIEAADVPGAGKEAKDNAAALRKRIADDPTHLGKVVVTELHPPQLTEICPPGTADVVLTFRNVHNWLETGDQQAMFNAFFKALKPGGVLGVVEHRARPGTSLEEMRKSGYMDEDYIRKLAATAGFRFDAQSPINNNPKDTKDYPRRGVDPAPDARSRGQGSRQVSGNRRVGSDDPEIREARRLSRTQDARSICVRTAAKADPALACRVLVSRY